MFNSRFAVCEVSLSISAPNSSTFLCRRLSAGKILPVNSFGRPGQTFSLSFAHARLGKKISEHLPRYGYRSECPLYADPNSGYFLPFFLFLRGASRITSSNGTLTEEPNFVKGLMKIYFVDGKME